MAIISQTPLFSREKVESSPEILRLTRVLEELPDEPIVRTLAARRKGKRNDYPIEAIEEKHPALHTRAEALSGDRDYDDGKDKAALYESHGIAPLIDTRDMRKKKGLS